MQILSIIILSAVLAFAQALTLPWLTFGPLVLMSVTKQAEGFFGMFRRRQVPKPPTRKEAPEGPVQFSMPSFSSQRPFQNPSFVPSFLNSPYFPNQMQGSNNQKQQQQQPWIPQAQNIPPQAQFPPSFGQNFQSQQQNFESNQEFDKGGNDETPGINTEEAESFFTLLAETDENKCISRLVCEMGADPTTAGELGQTISEIIGSLTDFPPGSKVSEYNEVLRRGRGQGISSCLSEYSVCDEETYNLMRSNQPEEQ